MQEVEAKRTKKHNSTKWTQEELDFVKRVYENMEYSIQEIGDAIDRSETAVTKKARSMGLTRVNPYVNKVTKEGHRICATCKQELPFEQFTKNKRKRYGVESSCKACQRLRKLQKEEEKKKNEAIKKTSTRVCRLCDIELSLTEENFSWNASKGAYAYYCKKCNAKKAQEASENNYREKGYKK